MAIKQDLKTMKWAAWLGWQMESNWADPFLFIVYSVAKPIAGALILVVMYSIITTVGGQSDPDFFNYMYVGNAFFMFVAQVLFGVTWIIHDDREHFQTLKYIYISPSNFFVYMLGRSISKIVITTFAVIITLAFGVFALGVPLTLVGINWPFFIIAMFIGISCIMAFGLALAGVSFLTAKHAMGMNEGIAGIFYLFCGVIFPISFLPGWGVAFGKILPITYWLDLMRGTLGVGTGVDEALSGISMGSSLIILCISTLVFTILAMGIFQLGDHIARRKGLIDMTTAY